MVGLEPLIFPLRGGDGTTSPLLPKLIYCHFSFDFVSAEPNLTSEWEEDSDTGYTSLHFAARFDNFNCIRLLLDHGADKHVESRNRQFTPYVIAIRFKAMVKASFHEHSSPCSLKRKHISVTQESLLDQLTENYKCLNYWSFCCFSKKPNPQK